MLLGVSIELGVSLMFINFVAQRSFSLDTNILRNVASFMRDFFPSRFFVRVSAIGHNQYQSFYWSNDYEAMQRKNYKLFNLIICMFSKIDSRGFQLFSTISTESIKSSRSADFLQPTRSHSAQYLWFHNLHQLAVTILCWIIEKCWDLMRICNFQPTIIIFRVKNERIQIFNYYKRI